MTRYVVTLPLLMWNRFAPPSSASDFPSKSSSGDVTPEENCALLHASGSGPLTSPAANLTANSSSAGEAFVVAARSAHGAGFASTTRHTPANPASGAAPGFMNCAAAGNGARHPN